MRYTFHGGGPCDGALNGADETPVNVLARDTDPQTGNRPGGRRTC
jgi:hypothetical protein